MTASKIDKIPKEVHSRKVLVGASFLISEKIIKLMIGLIVHALMARYLSPSRFGKMGYIINLATAFLPLTLFGLDDLGVKKILSSKDKIAEIISEILSIRLIAFLFVSIASGIVLLINQPEGGLSFTLMAWGFCMLYNLIGCFFTLELPYLTAVNNRPIFFSRLVGYISGTSLKLIGIFNKFSFLFILATYLIEEIISKTLVYLSFKGELKLRIKKLKGKDLITYIKPSFWIVAGSFFLVIEHKIGFLALEKLGNEKSLGFFTAAFMLVDLWTFVPLALISAILPSLIEMYTQNYSNFNKRIEDLHGLFFIVEAGFVASVWLVAPFLINTLYGHEYLGAEHFLRWQSLTVVIMFTQLLRMRWFLIEDALKIWASMIALEATISFILIFLWFGNDISEIVISIFISFLLVNILFCIWSSLVRKSLMNFLLAWIYSIRGLRHLIFKA